MAKKKSKSPYVRHCKAPYLYSALLQDWRKATLRGDVSEATRLARLHQDRCFREYEASKAAVRAEAQGLSLDEMAAQLSNVTRIGKPKTAAGERFRRAA